MLITLSATGSVCFGAKKFASWLFVMRITQFTLPEQSDWCDNMPIRSYDYAPVLPVNVSRPYFSTRPQGARAKNLVSGDETRGRVIQQTLSFLAPPIQEGSGNQTRPVQLPSLPKSAVAQGLKSSLITRKYT